jgi:hypothetical protein
VKELEAYLRELDGRLFLVSGRIRRDIVREVRGHLAEGAVEHGGGRRGMVRAIEEFGSPAELAKEYTDIYEPGPVVYVTFALVSAVLGALSHPFLGPVSTGAFAGAALILVYASLVAGKRVGIAAAIVAVVARFSVHAYLLSVYSDYVEARPLPLAMFAVGTLLLLVIGFVPGRIKERYFREDTI